jgi:hypothetical protein
VDEGILAETRQEGLMYLSASGAPRRLFHQHFGLIWKASAASLMNRSNAATMPA